MGDMRGIEKEREKKVHHIQRYSSGKTKKVLNMAEELQDDTSQNINTHGTV